MTTGAATRRVVLIGNPNTGKTTLFNALTGLTQRVGNYPGVTVEKKIGRLQDGTELVDLPGTYSLSAQSIDEMLAVDILLGHQPGQPRPDAVVIIVDASNLRRNLYLVTQVIEIGLPVVVALNMMDEAERAGMDVDASDLGTALGVPVVPIVASRSRGLDELKRAIESAGKDRVPSPDTDRWPRPLADEIDRLATFANVSGADRVLVGRALVDEGGVAESRLLAESNGELAGALNQARARIRRDVGPPATVEARARYAFIDGILGAVVDRGAAGADHTERIDSILLHRVLGPVLFVGVMALVFTSIFQWAGPVMDLISGAFDVIGRVLSGALAGTALSGGMLESLVVDGVLAGVGGVLVFLPQIALLFFFIAVLEDCGYMARTAHLMDRLLRGCGLSGQSFIPLLSSFACAVPGVMAARTIPDRRDRLVTILIAPLMSCSARIPVYTLMIAAFVPAVMVAGVFSLQGLVFGAMYLLGILVAIPVAMVLKRTVFHGPPPPFVMELPPYRWPSWRTVLLRVYSATNSFVRQAGTIILAMSILIWALGYFPHSGSISERNDAARTAAETQLSGEALEAALARIDGEEASEHLQDSFLGRMGHAVEPVVTPLGWDWKIGMAAIASFPAREVVVSTLGVIYDLGGADVGEESGQSALTDKLQAASWPDGRKVFTLPVALSIMVFFALCCQCGATVATIRRETNGWRWPIFTFSYMTALAYVGALLAYQIGTAAGL